MSALQEIQESIERIQRDVSPSVVGLGRGFGLGSGVVVGEGKVLTNAHNLRGDEVTLTFAGGREVRGRISGADADGDVAVIAAETAGTPPLQWSPQAASVAIGTPVFALANPGGRGLRVTFGLVSATGRSFRGPRGRRIRGSIEHTAPLPRGSSGGPIVDADGRLLGLNTIRLEGGLVVALAADDHLRERSEALGRGERPARVSLGLVVAPPRVARRMRRAVGLPERDGVLVRGATDESAGARAGLERGDLIVAAAGVPVEGVDDLYGVLDRLAPGDTLELTVVRGLDERRVAVPLTANGASEQE